MINKTLLFGSIILIDVITIVILGLTYYFKVTRKLKGDGYY